VTRLIIDTDVALGAVHENRPRDIDDGFAMVEAINATELDLVGVTTVYGNAPLETVSRIASEIVTHKSADVAVRSGAATALVQLGPDADLPPPNAAVEFIAHLLADKPASVAAIGPLTNIALLVHHYPQVLANIEQLIIVAGRSPGAEFFIGNAGPVGDFNFENDVRAARLVMGSGVPLVLAGFELTSQVTITAVDLETIRNADTDSARYFYRNSLAWCRYWVEQFPSDTGFHPWDSATIAWLRHPEYFTHEQRGWQIREVNDTHWLECDAAYAGNRVTYCTGFAPDGARAFVADVVSTVY
jgi:inosine-uridine nucleoside N-ribohydrolase